MKKILMILLALLFAMPMFAQKLNSRGEKMVKAMKCHTYYGGDITNIITFSYDENDEIVTLKSSYGDSYECIVGIKDGQVYTQNYLDGKKAFEDIVSITMSDGGNVKGYKRGVSDDNSYSYDEFTFYYIIDPTIGKPVITKEKEVTRCSASYFGDNDGASYNYVPTQKNEAKKAYKTEITHTYCWVYLIENGYTTCVKTDEQWNAEKTHKEPIVTKQLNDLNINLYGFLKNSFRYIQTLVLLRCSPWMPFACKYFPSVDSNGYHYIYTKDKKGNVIKISKLMAFGKDKNMLEETGDYIEIEYVEE